MKGQKKKRGEIPHDGHCDIRAVTAEFYKPCIFIHKDTALTRYSVTQRREESKEITPKISGYGKK